ncbi:MAG TPA: hypothetical protein ENO29_10205 [Candidatus Aminicenantes bacterium]|nr:MAG: hypothetical protein C0168_05780 [Candidatus Aminicenantes bacterium]HEK86707.1 hypothetical protein [Candidatus Aminicenantes bacterium]
MQVINAQISTICLGLAFILRTVILAAGNQENRYFIPSPKKKTQD